MATIFRIFAADTVVGSTKVAESVPDLRLEVAGLLEGTIDLNQFQHWFILAETEIEQRGSDQEVEFLDDVMLLLAEYTGDHISAAKFIAALREASESYALDREFASSSSS